MVERGCEEQHQAVAAPDEVLVDRRHRPLRPRSVGRPRQDAPRLGDRVDAALRVARRAERCAVVEEGAPVPVAVPAVFLERGAQALHVRSPAIGMHRVGTRLGDRDEGGERAIQEPAEPDALALALLADAVEAVVPVPGADQWETVGADAETAVDRCCAMVVEGSLPRRWFRLEVQVVLIGLEERSLQIRDRLVEDGMVGGDGEVAVDGVRQPQPVVGDVRAHAATGRGMPPVLDVALDELTCRGSKQVLAGELTLRHDQGDHVLELVAESVRAARLVERRPRPEPAGEGLVHEPAVEHDVQRTVRCSNLDRCLDVVPRAPDLAQRRGVVRGCGRLG